MSTKHHPLLSHLKQTGETLTAFAARVDMSRMHLYRIMNGENASKEKIQKIISATGGAVPANAFFDEESAA